MRSICLSLFAICLVALLGARAAACSVCDALAAPACGLTGSICMASDEPREPFARFTLAGSQWPQPSGDGTPVTITYSYNNFLDGGLKDPMGVSVSADYLRLVTEEAFGLWAAVAPLNFLEVPDVGTPVFTANTTAYNAYPADSFGQVRLNHRFINGTDAQNGMPTTKALAYFPGNGGNIAGDIHFDNGDPWAVVGTPSEPDVLGILTHEIGHTLGINHSAIDGAVMFPAALRRVGPGTGLLTDDDIAAVQSIYGAGVGSVTPLSAVPEPAALLAATIALAGWLPARRRRG
ncbi:Matrixin [Botrimarina colliarenosi]|uniref:Matrixin n=1 Tax=Botrimarina colliarenosi TaxID=2528001 RepID=A0A5C6ABT1_9BACT|nr:matrixin family metalloprotease [Botrimarina colliarenosi]TWT96870.1 Matrixin [Botrimarina colliarenosi]